MLASIEVRNFRCIANARLEFDPGATSVVGANASGKTSLLEAIYFLGHGRSFRANRHEKVIGQGGPALQVIGHFSDRGTDFYGGVEASPAGTEVHLRGRAVHGISELAGVFPVQVIDPGVHRLVEEGSARRRRLLDWGVFHVKHDFLPIWRRYQRALRQRNAALRVRTQPVDSWNEELVSAGSRVDSMRAEYVAALQSEFRHVANSLVGADAVLSYRRGWPEDLDLRSALTLARARDWKLGTTTMGAHRADLHLRFGNASARDRVSRGQQKLVAAALILAQVHLNGSMGGPSPCLLLDDPAAELDVDNLGKLLSAVAETNAQIVATSVNETSLSPLIFGRRFHVEQGCFTPML